MRVPAIRLGLFAVGMFLGLADPAMAVPLPSDAKLLLHVKAVTTKNQCSVTALGDNCANAVSKGNLTNFYHTLVLVERGTQILSTDGIAGVQFGISYQGQFSPAGDATRLNIFAWSLCATLEFASTGWPRPGTGNLITWDGVLSCQRSRLACAGYFYLGAYSPSTLFLTRRPSDNLAKVADCSAREFSVSDGARGYATFSAGAATNGCNPCLTSCLSPVAVEDVSWSRVKSLLD